MNLVLRTPWAGVVAAFALIGSATLVSLSTGPLSGSLPFWCLACGDFGVADAVANVALFVPLGWTLSRCGLRRPVAVGVIAATTIAVEALQYGVVGGRVPSVSDVLTNVMGGLVGMSVPALARWLTAMPRRALVAALTYGASFGVLLLTTLLVQAIPLPGPAALSWKQTVPDLPGYIPFSGALRDVRIDSGLAVRLVSARPDPGRAEIISTWRPDGSAWMWVDQQGRDILAHVVTSSDRWRLRGHSPVLGDVMPPVAGSPVTVAFAAGRYAYQLRVTTPSGERVRSLRLSPGDGWRLFMPFDRLRERWSRLLGGVWMAALLAPLGYLSAARSNAALGMAAGAVTSYLLLLPVLVGGGCTALPLASWGGAVAGIGVGAVGSRQRWTS